MEGQHVRHCLKKWNDVGANGALTMVAVTAPPSSELEHENAIVKTATAPGVKGKEEFGTMLGLSDKDLG